MNTPNTTPIPQGLRAISSERRDTEGKLILLDFQYELVNGNIQEAIEYIKSVHSNQVLLIPIGGQSAGGNVFSIQRKKPEEIVVGLIISPPIAQSDLNDIAYTVSDDTPAFPLNTQELHINKRDQLVYTGAGVVLDQIVATVKKALGPNYQVLGTDLTSSGYASAGATFMTGGMGPSRTNFARNVKEVTYYDGKSIQSTSDKDILEELVETYGWTSCIQSLTLPIVEIPPYEFGFAVPIDNTPDEISRLVAHFADKTLAPSELGQRELKETFIAGIEIIASDALDLLVQQAPSLPGLELLIKNCEQVNKNSVVFISGLARCNPFEDLDDPLGIFIDNTSSGLSLEQATPFKDLKAMKNIREGAPELARRQFSSATFSYKNHTDINVMVHKDDMMEGVKLLWDCYEKYKTNLESLIQSEEQLSGNVQVYGHMNPQGLDPHYRLSLISDNEEILLSAKKKAKAYYAELVCNISAVCKKIGATICGGEKGIISNMKIVHALESNQDDVPFELSTRLEKQRKRIAQAYRMFNWRAKI